LAKVVNELLVRDLHVVTRFKENVISILAILIEMFLLSSGKETQEFGQMDVILLILFILVNEKLFSKILIKLS
jgi:hypothetical protein